MESQKPRLQSLRGQKPLMTGSSKSMGGCRHRAVVFSSSLSSATWEFAFLLQLTNHSSHQRTANPLGLQPQRRCYFSVTPTLFLFLVLCICYSRFLQSNYLSILLDDFDFSVWSQLDSVRYLYIPRHIFFWSLSLCCPPSLYTVLLFWSDHNSEIA